MLPLYREIKLSRSNMRFLKGILDHTSLGKFPSFIDLSPFPEEEASLLESLRDYAKVNPERFKFPYPLYVISRLNLFRDVLNIVHSPQELPRFWDLKEKRPNVREMGLLSHNRLRQEKLMLINLKELLKYSVGSSRVDLQACKLEYSIVSPK